MDIYENIIKQCSIINFIIDKEGTIIDTNIYTMSLFDIYDMKGKEFYSLLDSMSQFKVKSSVTTGCREPFSINLTTSSGVIEDVSITCSKVNDYIVIIGMLKTKEEDTLSEQLKDLNHKAGFRSDSAGDDGQTMRMWQISNIDALTGLYNRSFFNSMYEGWYENIKYRNTNPGIIMIGIDYFHMLNDKYGLKKCDSILVGLSQIILSCIRSTDYAIRYESDKFLILLNNISSSTIVKIAERIRQGAKEELGITISAGCTSFDAGHPVGKEEFVKQAADALLVSENRGRNVVTAV